MRRVCHVIRVRFLDNARRVWSRNQIEDVKFDWEQSILKDLEETRCVKVEWIRVKPEQSVVASS